MSTDRTEQEEKLAQKIEAATLKVNAARKAKDQVEALNRLDDAKSEYMRERLDRKRDENTDYRAKSHIPKSEKIRNFVEREAIKLHQQAEARGEKSNLEAWKKKMIGVAERNDQKND